MIILFFCFAILRIKHAETEIKSKKKNGKEKELLVSLKKNASKLKPNLEMLQKQMIKSEQLIAECSQMTVLGVLQT